jgi:hypothetical protein
LKSNKNIIDQRELSILVSLYGLSFMLKNKEDDSLKHFEYLFDNQNPISLEEKLLSIIEERPVLKEEFASVKIIHHNNLNALVPQEFFNPNLLKDYLKFNIQLLDNDFADFDSIDNLESNNVYLPFVNINNVFLDYNSMVNYYHSGTIFLNKITKLLKQSLKLSLYQVFINVYPKDFQLAIFINEKLYLYNHFEFEHTDEFLYYLFFALESIGIDEQKTKYKIFGIDEQNDIVKNLQDFTGNLTVFSSSLDSKLNNFIL